MENVKTEGLLKEVQELIENSKLPKKTKSEIEIKLRNIDKILQSNAQFYYEQFQEQVENTIVEAKSEIEQYRDVILSTLGQKEVQKILLKVVFEDQVYLE